MLWHALYENLVFFPNPFDEELYISTNTENLNIKKVIFTIAVLPFLIVLKINILKSTKVILPVSYLLINTLLEKNSENFLFQENRFIFHLEKKKENT
jgi:hypothetical protein